MAKTKKRQGRTDSHPKPGRMIFCCSGASNVGVLSYLASMRLSQEGFGGFSCIAGIGGNVPPMVEAARSAEELILIDGCPTGCGRRILDMNNVSIGRYFIVTEMGIKKTHDLDVDESDVDMIIGAVQNPQI